MLLLGSCGGDARAPELQTASQAEGFTGSDLLPETGTATGNAAAPGSPIDLDSALREIAALETPADVDAEMFAKLKAELERLLGNQGEEHSNKQVSAVISSRRSRFYSDYMHVRVDHQAHSLRWLYMFPGDYDQNGTVNAADLVPLAQHFGADADREAAMDFGWFPAGTMQYVVDGNFDGEINLGDIVPIAGNFAQTFFSCTVSGGLTRLPGDKSEGLKEWQVPFELAGIGPQGQKEFELEIVDPLTSFYTVIMDGVTLDSSSPRGFGRSGSLYESAYGRLLPIRMSSTNLQYDALNNSASWRQFHSGDGNRDGIVDDTDFTLIGVYFLDRTESDSTGVIQYVDYDQNSEVGISDLTPFGLHFGGGFEGYSLFYAQSEQQLPDGYWGEEINTPLLSMGYLELPLPMKFSYELPFTPASGSYLYLRPYLGEELGPVCEFVEIQ
ncbi:MAG: hypothetical protein R3F46_01315 [bacterium]